MAERRLAGVFVGVVTGLTLTATSCSAPREPPPRLDPPTAPARAFAPGSWWNTPIPSTAPAHPDEAEILEYLRTAPGSGGGCLRLAGAADNPWGQPVYDAGPKDPAYDVRSTGARLPPELARLRIPQGAQPAVTSDAAMTVFDRDRGYVVALTGADYDPAADTWSVRGATVTYLASNGLHVDTGRADDPRNRGSHRGNNGATMMVRYDEVADGAVRHVLKVASGPETSGRYVFPMVGSDGGYRGTDPAVPPQGLRLRIRPSVDLEELELNPQAAVIARALQQYGMYLGDSGGVTSLKLEDTRLQGRGQLWQVRPKALCGLPFSPGDWDVLPEGYVVPPDRGG